VAGAKERLFDRRRHPAGRCVSRVVELVRGRKRVVPATVEREWALAHPNPGATANGNVEQDPGTCDALCGYFAGLNAARLLRSQAASRSV
jgi:hypothetical protein